MDLYVIQKTFSFWFPLRVTLPLFRQQSVFVFLVVSFVVVALPFTLLFPRLWVCNLQNFICTFDLLLIACIPLCLIPEPLLSILAVILLFFKVGHARSEHGVGASSIFFSEPYMYM